MSGDEVLDSITDEEWQELAHLIHGGNMPSKTFAEINLEGDLALDERYVPSVPAPPGVRVVPLAGLVQQLEQAEARGIRVALVTIDSDGGNGLVAFAVYEALRAFSDGGGKVVAYVPAYAASSAAVALLGADYVVMAPGSSIHPHGALMDASRASDMEAADAILTADSVLAGALYASHTLASSTDVVRWLGQPGEEIDSVRALDVGYADAVGDLEVARSIAASLAAGEEVPSHRRAALAKRGELPDVLVEAATGARELGDAVLAAVMSGCSAGSAARFVLERMHPLFADLLAGRESMLEGTTRIFRNLRLGASVVFLFGKIPTGLKQLLGLATSAKELRRRHLVSGVRKFLREGWGEVAANSPEFKFMDQQLDRDARDLFRSLEGSFTEMGGLKRHVTTYAAAPIMLCQKAVNAITWYAAREQAIEERHPDPNAYADSIVTMTQTGGGAKDLAKVQRGPELTKLGTIFFSYRSVLYNQLTEQMPGKTVEQRMLARSAHFWWLVLLPVLVQELLLDGVKDDEDEDDVAKRVGLEIALAPVSTLPFIGDMASSALAGRPQRYAPWVDTIGRNMATAGKAIQGGDITEGDVKSLVELVGMTTKMPTQALWNAGDYIDRLLAGELDEPVQDLLFRSPSNWE